MHIKIGSGTYIDPERIIGLFDMDTATISSSTRAFLTGAQKKKQVILTDEDIPKSFILADDKKSKIKKYKKTNKKEKREGKGKSIFLCKLSTGAIYGRLSAGVGEITNEDE